jgi:hypothetical protein
MKGFDQLVFEPAAFDTFRGVRMPSRGEKRGSLMRMRVLLVLCTTIALTVGVAAAMGGNGGNSANAKLCYKGGWQTLARSNGSSFASQDACVSYAANGGTLLHAAPISTYLYSSSEFHQSYDVTGTGFTANHAISFTASGFGTQSYSYGSGTVTTNGSGAFNSGTSGTDWWGVYLSCSDGPQTIHITATDGVHTGVTDLVWNGC